MELEKEIEATLLQSFQRSSQICFLFVAPVIASIGGVLDYLLFSFNRPEVYFMRAGIIIYIFLWGIYQKRVQSLILIQVIVMHIVLLCSCWMTYLSYHSGGFLSPYRDGVAIVAFNAGIFFPFSRAFFLILPFASYGPYIAACLFLTNASNDPMADGAIFMLIQFGVSIIAARILINKIQTQEVVSRVALRKELEDRERIITEQVTQISEANLAYAIADTAQKVAHDVRKPFVQFRLFQKVVASAKDFESLKDILLKFSTGLEKSLTYVDGMLADLLTYRGKSHAQEFTVEDCETVIRRAIDQATLNANISDAKLQVSITTRQSIKIQKGRIERAIVNLVSNAIEESKDKDFVYVRAFDKDRQCVQIEVENTGFISPEMQKKIFEPFFTSGKKGGTGLGLKIANQIVKEHGSELVLKCEEGTISFSFRLQSPLDLRTNVF